MSADLDLAELRAVAEGASRQAGEALWPPRRAKANAAHIAAYDPTTVLALLDRLEAAEAAVERVRAIRTHNGTPISPTNLRWAATHEALCRSFIFEVLTALADALDGEQDGGA